MEAYTYRLVVFLTLLQPSKLKVGSEDFKARVKFNTVSLKVANPPPITTYGQETRYWMTT
jgi:hypothetical protein